MAPGIALKAVSGARRRLRVLDPMMGSGTVLAAARAKGHRALGVDIDPLAVLIAKVWITAIEKAKVRTLAEKILADAQDAMKRQTHRTAYPKGADSETKAFIRYWFDPYARRQLTCLSNSIRRCRDKNARDALWCAFSRLIITKQAGTSLALDLAHSRPHKHFKTAPLKPFANFLKATDRVLENCLSISDKDRGPAANVCLGDARRLKLKKNSIDLVLTSPPYLNAIDYLRCSKFSLVWMGHRIEALRNVRSVSVGSEVGKYDDANDSFSKKLIAHLKLSSRLSSGKQAVLARFISDMDDAIREVSRVLAPGGKAIYVVGENTIRGTYVENAKIIRALAERAGLKLRSQTRRKLPPNRRYLPPPSRDKNKRSAAGLDNRMRREIVLHFVKPRRVQALRMRT
jgi:DNA modification methylase